MASEYNLENSGGEIEKRHYNRRKNTKEENVLFNDALNTFYLGLYGVRHMVKNYLVREETRRRHYMEYSFRLAARDLLYAPSHTQDIAYHGLSYTSSEALVATRNSTNVSIMAN